MGAGTFFLGLLGRTNSLFISHQLSLRHWGRKTRRFVRWDMSKPWWRSHWRREFCQRGRLVWLVKQSSLIIHGDFFANIIIRGIIRWGRCCLPWLSGNRILLWSSRRNSLPLLFFSDRGPFLLLLHILLSQLNISLFHLISLCESCLTLGLGLFPLCNLFRKISYGF